MVIPPLVVKLAFCAMLLLKTSIDRINNARVRVSAFIKDFFRVSNDKKQIWISLWIERYKKYKTVRQIEKRPRDPAIKLLYAFWLQNSTSSLKVLKLFQMLEKTISLRLEPEYLIRNNFRRDTLAFNK